MTKAMKLSPALAGLCCSAIMLLLFAGAVHPQTSRRARAQRPGSPASRAASEIYACPMHPDVTSKSPGKCPKCGMALRPVRAGSAQSAAPAPGETIKKAEAVVGKLRIPDTAVYDQDGKRLNFYTDLVKGKTVAINFIFTTCTTICPPLTATFRKLQQTLGERVGREVELISISVDPATDVPERLKSFAAKFKAAPGWTFVTGSKPEIDELLKALGAAVADKNDHTPMILIGNDAAGYWTRTYGLAPSATLAAMVEEAAGKSAGQSAASSAASTPPTTSAAATPAAGREEPGAAVKPNAAMAKGAADYFPNLELRTQDDKPVRFYDDMLKGKIVLINFMFATCKGACSPMTANMAKVQQYLGDHVGREVRMISISVDPETDTPAALKKYADSFKAKPGWYFLTGKKENVDWVLYKLGNYVEDKNEHGLALIIGNEATGEWIKVHAMSNPSEIASAVTKLLPAKND
ncbi:MAG: SCO family protein [Acidobacteria bacterium]|nr:SCO family protein [Acidobacteriota bacterium]